MNLLKRLSLAFTLIQVSMLAFGQIIADHTVVERYKDIPQEYINEVKKMWASYAGESHSEGIRVGLQMVENLDNKFAVKIRESGTPDPYTTSSLRFSRATWGDVDNASGWLYGYGEEDWFTSATAINRTKAGLSYIHTNGPKLTALGFGWCWDNGVNFTDYINATIEYINYCNTQNIGTKVFFTTGTVDEYDGEEGYTKHLGYEQIRTAVRGNNSRILFDYADILCHDNDGNLTTSTWNGNIYPFIAGSNYTPTVASYHISEAGALRLGKAMWWMLARIAGWEDVATNVKEQSRTSSIIRTSNGELEVEVNEAFEFKNVRLYDLQGRKVADKIIDGKVCKINISDLTAGIYMVSLSGETSVETKKVIIGD